jgi:hypothetical protein
MAACQLRLSGPQPLPTIQPTSSSVPATATVPPSPTATMEMCAFVWAYQDLPDITQQVKEAIQAVQAQAEARAQAFGENCVYQDGRATFGAMETDFYITLQAKNLNNPDELGGLIVQTMKVLEQFPHGKVPGGQDGFVEIRFKSKSQEKILRVPIGKYKDLPPGTSNRDIYQTFIKQ